MNRLEAARDLPENKVPKKQFAIDTAILILKNAKVKDPGMTTVATPVEEQAEQISEAPVEIKIFSRNQLILPETTLSQDVSDVLQRTEKVGIGVFEAYHLSGFTLGKGSDVEGWNIKPGKWYWNHIRNGKVSQDAATLPNSWVLIDKTQKPDYKDGKQMYENDPLGPMIARLRKDGKIQKVEGIPDASRFGISHDELTQVVLPEIASLLGVDFSQVRLPKAIEFNVIGNLKHSEWGKRSTWEWFDDKFEDSGRLVGGCSSSRSSGLSSVRCHFSANRYGFVGFRLLIVVPTNVSA